MGFKHTLVDPKPKMLAGKAGAKSKAVVNFKDFFMIRTINVGNQVIFLPVKRDEFV